MSPDRSFSPPKKRVVVATGKIPAPYRPQEAKSSALNNQLEQETESLDRTSRLLSLKAAEEEVKR